MCSHLSVINCKMVKVVAVADTHNAHQMITVPDGDVFICAGDWTMIGGKKQIKDFLDWVEALPHLHKIVIAGNHDLDMDPKTPMFSDLKMEELLAQYPNIHYLSDTGVRIDVKGRFLNVWGSPFSPKFQDWAFQYEPGERTWDAIPDDTDILVTHTPPKHILDTVVRKDGREANAGCSQLRERVMKLKPKAHIFGHLHYDGGKMIIQNGTTFVNAAIGYRDEWFPDETPEPVVFELFPN